MNAPRLVTDRALVARSVTKTFGAVRALDEVEIVVRAGTVHALVGENGAGKSTLAKILAGIEQADTATMTFSDRPYAPRDRAAAKARGVNMVPQQLSLVGELSLVENFLLVGREKIARRARARALLEQTLEKAGVQVDLDVPTGALSQAHRQLGEIVVALAEGATTLILDEPTASLGPHEVGGLFEHLRTLCARGTAIVLITHRLDEVRSVADDVTVLSHGRLVHTGDARGLRPEEIARLMVGDLPEPAARATRRLGDVVLSAEGVHATGAVPLTDVTLHLRAGEIVGLAGVAGSGQTALVDVLAGFDQPTAGRLRYTAADGSVLTGPDAAALQRADLAWIPEERTAALVPTMTLAETLGLYDAASGAPRLQRRRPTTREDTRERLRSFDVRPGDPTLPAGGLSGGNQQKLLVARELGGRTPRVVLAYGPTQGLDLRAAQAIRERLIAAAEAGAAVLVASHDLEELLGLADRIAVMFGGRLVAEFPAASATTERLGAAMAGIVPLETGVS